MSPIEEQAGSDRFSSYASPPHLPPPSKPKSNRSIWATPEPNNPPASPVAANEALVPATSGWESFTSSANTVIDSNPESTDTPAIKTPTRRVPTVIDRSSLPSISDPKTLKLGKSYHFPEHEPPAAKRPYSIHAPLGYNPNRQVSSSKPVASTKIKTPPPPATSITSQTNDSPWSVPTQPQKTVDEWSSSTTNTSSSTSDRNGHSPARERDEDGTGAQENQDATSFGWGIGEAVSTSPVSTLSIPARSSHSSSQDHDSSPSLASNDHWGLVDSSQGRKVKGKKEQPNSESASRGTEFAYPEYSHWNVPGHSQSSDSSDSPADSKRRTSVSTIETSKGQDQELAVSSQTMNKYLTRSEFEHRDDGRKQHVDEGTANDEKANGHERHQSKDLSKPIVLGWGLGTEACQEEVMEEKVDTDEYRPQGVSGSNVQVENEAKPKEDERGWGLAFEAIHQQQEQLFESHESEEVLERFEYNKPDPEHQRQESKPNDEEAHPNADPAPLASQRRVVISPIFRAQIERQLHRIKNDDELRKLKSDKQKFEVENDVLKKKNQQLQDQLAELTRELEGTRHPPGIVDRFETVNYGTQTGGIVDTREFETQTDLPAPIIAVTDIDEHAIEHGPRRSEPRRSASLGDAPVQPWRRGDRPHRDSSMRQQRERLAIIEHESSLEDGSEATNESFETTDETFERNDDPTLDEGEIQACTEAQADAGVEADTTMVEEGPDAEQDEPKTTQVDATVSIHKEDPADQPAPAWQHTGPLVDENNVSLLQWGF
ncbi:uncharacterized protein JCM15063_004480 [Sporobolomyces koalae]|uniref:uncharacterized protein n=1 Tax=Sporobolomyces koalae TaxID=500713 RepID=UPI00316C212E